jgi:hypothetical protein
MIVKGDFTVTSLAAALMEAQRFARRTSCTVEVRLTKTEEILVGEDTRIDQYLQHFRLTPEMEEAGWRSIW